VNTRTLSDYLLGKLPDAEAEGLEERFFADDAVFEELLAAEGELIDRYVDGELSRPDRARFEARLSRSPEWRRRVDSARALRRAARGALPTRRGWREALGEWIAAPRLQLGLAAATVLLVIGVAWLAAKNARLRAAVRHAAPAPPPLVVAFSVTPGLVREAAGPKRIVVPPAAGAVALSLQIDRDDARREFRAVLRRVDGADVFSADGLASAATADGRAVVFQVPAAVLTPGDYTAVLMARTGPGQVHDVGDYYLRVVR
jgi:hypothetical protein